MNGSPNEQGKSKALAHNGDILKIKTGVITIDPNAYSTGTPSGKYPHSQIIKQGQWKIVTGQAGQQQPTQQQPNATQPQQAPTQNQNQAAPAAPAPAPKTTPAAGSISSIESRVIELTNAERKKAGLPALQADTKLSNVAREKSRDMQQKGYFSHTSPTYGSPFDMMRDFGITYQSAGENIAKGQRTPEEVVQAWMNSEGHRKNILSGNYSHIGVGYVEAGNHWTQMFIKK
ncbi:CAP domain-containing protein [Robertmurraya sp. P23]|uniref:CAP domain-containing protein n=1 Tax=Robertmurraya sp. P23 TaxID=3436931 RepID=UPI003D9849A0